MSRQYRVIASPSVFIDPASIFEHIERWTEDHALAARTVGQIREYIGALCDTPRRGTRRDDLRPGLRIVTFRKRTAIAREIDETARTVTILRIFYGGQDYETALHAP